MDIHGCYFGLKSVRDPNVFIKKGWRIATSCDELISVLNKCQCPGGHPHFPCMGVETKQSAHYPPKLALTMLKAYKKHDIEKMVKAENAALAIENELFLTEAAMAATNEELEEFKKLTGKEREQLVNAARKIHINTGHKPVTELAKLLRQNNAPKASRAAMESVKCSTCLEHSRPASAPVASLSTAKEPWKCLGINIKETRDKGQKLKYLVFVDEATRLVRCKLLFSIPEAKQKCCHA